MKPEPLNGAAIYETKRMICRRWLRTDVESLFAVYSDPEGSKWVGDGTPITRDECEAWIEVTANNYTTRGYGMFALVDGKSKKTIGFCGLVHPNGQADVELKYAFARARWGEGLASEAIPSMTDFAANILKIGNIIATVAPQNSASQRVLLKSGFCFAEEKEDNDGERIYLYRWTARDVPR